MMMIPDNMTKIYCSQQRNALYLSRPRNNAIQINSEMDVDNTI